MMQGFPGTLRVNATYTLTADNQLQLVIQATTDATTPINLAQHSYFNLNSEASGKDILNHAIFIDGYASAAQTWFSVVPKDSPLGVTCQLAHNDFIEINFAA